MEPAIRRSLPATDFSGDKPEGLLPCRGRYEEKIIPYQEALLNEPKTFGWPSFCEIVRQFSACN